MTHKMGRPTKYEPSMCDKVDDYLLTCGREQTTLPTLEGFSEYLDCDVSSLENWSKLYPDFFRALGRVTKIQKMQLINDGIYGGKEVNSTIVKLLLQNNHGMKERTDTTTNDKDVQGLVIVKSYDDKNIDGVADKSI
jgi:hypothetical protein